MNEPAPSADLQFSFNPDLATGNLIVDLVLSPQGDLATVSGIDKLAQNVKRWLLAPRGSVLYDPTYGNPYDEQVGIAGTDLPDLCARMIQAAQGWFTTHQQKVRLAREEQLDRLSLLDVAFESADGSQCSPKFVILTFSVASKAGETKQDSLPLPLTAHGLITDNLSNSL